MPERLRSDMKLPVRAGSSPKFSVCGTDRQFLSLFASILVQKVRWCGGGIRLLVVQEAGGQLLAQKKESCARLVSPTHGVRA